MTKKVIGVNPDFADFDEIDTDALDAIDDYEQGDISFAELKTLIGHEAAKAVEESLHGSEDLDSLFDDPEDFDVL